MKHYLIGFILFAFVSSCVRSLYPLTNNEGDFIFKKELLGNWKVIKEEGKVSFEYDKDVSYIVDTMKGSGGKCYQITYILTDSALFTSDTSYLLATLVKIGENYFLDCFTDTSRNEFKQLDELSDALLLNLHVIARIKIVDRNTILISYINQDKLESFMDDKKISINHTFIYHDELLLLEEPDSLKQKLLTPGGLISLFSNEETVKRY